MIGSPARWIAGAALVCAALVSSACAEPPETNAPPSGPMTFDQLVQHTLTDSPLMKKARIEIGLRRLDESDSRSDFLPSLYLDAGYVFNPPDTADSPYYLSLNTGNYSLVDPFFSLRARKLITRIAELTVLQGVSDGLQRLGSTFLEIDALRRIRALQDEMLGVADLKTAYFCSRTNASGSQIEAQVAEQERAVIGVDARKSDVARQFLLNGIALVLGWSTNAPVELDTRDAATQVLAGFDPSSLDVDSVLAHSFEAQIRALHRELQELNIKIAYAAFAPQPFLSLRSSDPINGSGDDGLFLSAGFNLPIWDGFKRNRNVARQKQILRRQVLDDETGGAEWQQKWLDAASRAEIARAELEQSRNMETIAGLRLQQAHIAFEAGSQPASAKFDGNLRFLESRIASIQKELALHKALLDLRALARELCDRYIRLQELQKIDTE